VIDLCHGVVPYILAIASPRHGIVSCSTTSPVVKMRYSSSSFTFLALNLAVATCHNHSSGWAAKNFKTLVTFGDSYTDESRVLAPI
jgi:hypothetical protein